MAAGAGALIRALRAAKRRDAGGFGLHGKRLPVHADARFLLSAATKIPRR
jgi:hypothetical protein